MLSSLIPVSMKTPTSCTSIHLLISFVLCLFAFLLGNPLMFAIKILIVSYLISSFFYRRISLSFMLLLYIQLSIDSYICFYCLAIIPPFSCYLTLIISPSYIWYWSFCICPLISIMRASRFTCCWIVSPFLYLIASYLCRSYLAPVYIFIIYSSFFVSIIF